MPISADLLRLATKQSGCFSRHQAVAINSASALRHLVSSGAARHVAPNVYLLVGFSTSWEQRAWIALLSIPGAVLSHKSAARVWGLKKASDFSIEITVPRDSPVRRKEWIVHSSAQLKGWTEIRNGFPVTGAARTLVDLSKYFEERRLGKIVDEACRLKIVRLAEIQHCMDQMVTKGRPKITRMQSILRSRNTTDERIDTELEAKALEWIRKANLPDPVPQFWIDARGNHYRLDLAYLQAKIDIEPDGPHHRLPTVAAYDRLRDSDVSLEGWHVIRVPTERTEAEFVDQLIAALQRRAS